MSAKWAGRRATNAKRWCQANLGYICWLCGRPIESEADYSVDHVVPRSVDPTLTWEPGNWRPAHLRRHDSIGCPGNSGRGARPVAPRVNSRRW
jgi:5-methylcytosine-specific restriction endonuclease McrA